MPHATSRCRLPYNFLRQQCPHTYFVYFTLACCIRRRLFLSPSKKTKKKWWKKVCEERQFCIIPTGYMRNSGEHFPGSKHNTFRDRIVSRRMFFLWGSERERWLALPMEIHCPMPCAGSYLLMEKPYKTHNERWKQFHLQTDRSDDGRAGIS